MKKVFISIVAVCLCSCFTTLNAQVTIGNNSEPNSNAVLDLISNGNKGLLLPRVALSATNDPAPTTVHTAGMTVYNTATSDVAIAFEYYVSPGLYYNDGTKWVRLPLGYTNWFYMPSISFDTSSNGTGRTKNLYTLYYNQFKTPLVKSTGAPISVPYIPAATDLYYYITDYDTAVFANISISASGLMTYDVISSATSCSYINIVFALK
jgi:hypothetical protein